jgi:hypothetical protein
LLLFCKHPRLAVAPACASPYNTKLLDAPFLRLSSLPRGKDSAQFD